MNVDSQLEIIVYYQTLSHLREGDTRFELTTKDLITPIQEPSVRHLKNKGKHL